MEINQGTSYFERLHTTLICSLNALCYPSPMERGDSIFMVTENSFGVRFRHMSLAVGPKDSGPTGRLPMTSVLFVKNSPEIAGFMTCDGLLRLTSVLLYLHGPQ